MKLLNSIILLLITCSYISAQGDLLTTFKAIQVENGIKLTFTIKAGNQCNDLEIQRSDDDILFTEIGIIPGICGSVSSNETYEFTDALPIVNKDVYYRLNLRDAGYSFSIKTRYIAYNEKGYLIYPNPFSINTNVYIKNERNTEIIFSLYDITGKLMLRKNTKDNIVPLSRDNLNDGIYIYKIIFDDKVKGSGRLIIH
ncbi:MAG: T9SS type A sorting domain-containing protein [Bacteroidia bacterium]